MNYPPIRTAVVGIGGFAGAHHTALGELEASGTVKVVATCDPRVHELDERRGRYRFAERGVAVYSDFETMLASQGRDMDLVTVASPISVHAEHHLACVERGIACYLEKPPTLDPDELEGMIAAEKKARFATQVGFNYIAQPWRLRLKERILDGDFGRLRHVGFKGIWRRSLAYFERNAWAGRLFLDDRLLLDSCCGNAMSHFLHNLLFHAGSEGLLSWAAPETVEAELYRANFIEGADTVFARGTLEGRVTFCLAATHACEPALSHCEVLECEKASIEISGQGTGIIRYRDGRAETFSAEDASLGENLRGYCEFLQGARSRPVTTLQDCRPFVTLNALLYLAAGKIFTVSEALAVKVEDDIRATRCIPGIEAACEQLLRTKRLPSEQSQPWSGAGGRSTLEDLPRLRLVLGTLRSSADAPGVK